MKSIVYILILSAAVFLSACSRENIIADSSQQSSSIKIVNEKNTQESKTSKSEVKDAKNQEEPADNSCGPNLAVPAGELKVHFQDVGQGDSILIQDGSSVMLVDAGDRDDGDNIIDYMKLRGINHIDYLVATHTHENHIGGMASIIKNFSIGTVYMAGKSSDSAEYKEMIAALEASGLKFSTPPPGTNFNIGETVCTVMAPAGSSYGDENDNSIVIKMVHGSMAFLLAGDAGIISEKEMRAKNYNISANVLKVSDHGNNNSTSKEFLDKVKPQYAIVSVDSKQAASIETVLTRLKDAGTKIYKTIEYGTIILKSNKEKINIEFGFNERST